MNSLTHKGENTC